MKLSDSVVSMPAELARQQARLVVRPNRERIRQILATSSVLELQRQLLTSVMENEVWGHSPGDTLDRYIVYCIFYRFPMYKLYIFMKDTIYIYKL